MTDYEETPLEVIFKERPDYNHYLQLDYWSLYDSACLLIEKWPDTNKKNWSEFDKDDFDEMFRMLESAYLSEALSYKKGENGRVLFDKDKLIGWAKKSFGAIPKEIENYIVKNGIKPPASFYDHVNQLERKNDWFEFIEYYAKQYFDDNECMPTESILWNMLCDQMNNDWGVVFNKDIRSFKMQGKTMNRESFKRKYKKYFN